MTKVRVCKNRTIKIRGEWTKVEYSVEEEIDTTDPFAINRERQKLLSMINAWLDEK